MMRKQIFFFVLLVALPALCAAGENLSSFAGTWESPQSSAVYTITLSGDTVQVSAVDSGDGEVFHVQDVRFMEGSLFFTSTMPSTGWTVYHQLTPAGPDRLEVFRSGSSTKAGALFRVREKED